MTSPLAPPDGAFAIGGGDYKYGQDYTESQIRSMFTVPNPVNGNPLEMLAETLAKLPLEVLQMFRELVPDPLLWLWDTVDNAVDAIMHALTTPPIVLLQEALDAVETMWEQFAELVQGFVITPLNSVMVTVSDWWGTVTQALQDGVDAAGEVVDDLWSGLMRTLGIGKSSSDVSNAATQISQQAKDSIDLGEWNNAILGVRQNKHIMQGIDETEESTFLMSDLFNSGAAPPFMSVTSAAVPIAFWRAEEWAKKGFISWFGEGTTDITAMYVDIYKMNYTTSEMELIHTSADISGITDATWKYMVYYLPEVDRFEVFPGDVIGIALRITGTGTHKVAAKSAPWLPAHPTVVPSKPAATRTGSGTLAFGSITYATDLPWFGIGIVTGDTPPLFFTPRTAQLSAAGAHTYTIPSWANFVDVVLVGGGGGGAGGTFHLAQHGEGGGAGSWAVETLERGVDFPVGATTLTVTVGGGGALGTQGNDGSNGSGTVRAAIASGKAAWTAAGGAGGTGQASGGDPITLGDSPGNQTYNTVTYIGGGTAASPAAKAAPAGKTPGGGGGGGAGGGFGLAWWGGAGATGAAWLVARQS